ncbi:MAG: hypothetical protein C0193_00525 [Candidatus Bathyarchaeota archaeon]|nr:MAG: hypothetical protein C0193_00525 [Candidatus Bathyarchaeota archaeon]
MVRKAFKVYLSKEQELILERICRNLGLKESEVLRYAFMEYAEKLNLISERVHGRFYSPVLKLISEHS